MTVYPCMLRRAARPVVLWIVCMLCSLGTAPSFNGIGSAHAADAVRSATSTMATERDILGVAQDLTPFVRKAEQAAQSGKTGASGGAGKDAALLAPAEQAIRDARSNQIFFSPWAQTKPSLSAKDFRAHILRKPRGYCMDQPWGAGAWQGLIHNTNAAAYPAAKGSAGGPAIVTRHTDMRSMPTDKPLFMEGTAEPTVDYFDFFQHASLALGTPVYVSHTSADRKWLYVEYPLLSGWVRAADVAFVNRENARAYAKGPFAVVVRDGTMLAYDGEGGHKTETALGPTYIGSVFPYAAEGPVPVPPVTFAPVEPSIPATASVPSAIVAAAADVAGDILVPVRNSDGSARMQRVRPPQGSVLPKPLPLTPAAVAALGTQMLGQPYGWGGITHHRDCSLTMRDLFLPFGIWLARNSRSQVQVKGFRKLRAVSPEERKATILREGVPFMTLLGFPGHVGLFVGVQDGEPIMLHNILGLRTSNAEQNYRHIIAKGILSTLEPGKDQPDLQLRETLLERLGGMRHLP